MKSQSSSIFAHFRQFACELKTYEGFIDLEKNYPDGTCSNFIYDRIFARLADTEDNHKIFEEFDLGSDRTIHMRIICHLVSVN